MEARLVYLLNCSPTYFATRFELKQDEFVSVKERFVVVVIEYTAAQHGIGKMATEFDDV